MMSRREFNGVLAISWRRIPVLASHAWDGLNKVLVMASWAWVERAHTFHELVEVGGGEGCDGDGACGRGDDSPSSLSWLPAPNPAGKKGTRNAGHLTADDGRLGKDGGATAGQAGWGDPRWRREMYSAG